MSNADLARKTTDLSNALVAKALQDAAFRAQLMKDPKGTLEKALGAPLPSNFSFKVVEAAPDAYTLVLPYEPKTGADGEMSDADLESVAGGARKAGQPFPFPEGGHVTPGGQPISLGPGFGDVFLPC